MTSVGAASYLWASLEQIADGHPFDRDDLPIMRECLAAIEAEARAAVLRELREEVAGLRHQHLQWPPIDGEWVVVLDRREVLAAIDRRLGDGSL